MQPSHHRNEDPLGLGAWAAASGLRPSVGLALVATIHANVAGASAGLCGENWYHDVAPPHFVCDVGDLTVSMALSVLTSSLQRRQEVLVGRARGFTTEELESAYHDGGFMSRNYRFLQELGNPQPSEIGIQAHSCEASFERDSEVAAQTITLENYLRPSFMLTGALPDNVSAVASRSLGGRLFIGGAVVHLPSGSQARQKRVEELIVSATGTLVETRLTSRSPMMAETVQARGILRMQRTDLEALSQERSDFFCAATPLVGSPPDPSCPVDYAAADRFQAHLVRSLDHAIAVRRARAGLHVTFSSKAALDEFRSQDRVFRLETASLPPALRLDGLADLPAAMACSLLTLARHADIDAYVIDTVFTCAREIREGAVRFLQTSQHAAAARDLLKLAGKVVERLRRVGPCKRRALVRGFDKQGLDHIEPVLQSLLAAGVIVQSTDLTLSLGQVPVASLSIADVFNPGCLP